MAQPLPISLLQKALAAAGVALFAAGVLWIAPLTVIARTLSLDGSPHVRLFELHFWQYSIAFLAVIILSRGHLWSYGINSQNLKTSLEWLAWLYGAVVLCVLTAWVMDLRFVPAGTESLISGSPESIAAMLVYWMSSPVANQILFFGFAQTVLIKQWGDTVRIAGLPLAVHVAAVLFAAGATTSRFAGAEAAFLPTLLLGLFCGTVYWRTNSLITPMLGHAFYLGFPLFVQLLRSGGIR